MPKTKDQIRTEIASALQNQNLNALVEALAEANLKIAELEQKLESGDKKAE
jgi:uncharacterized coiled-coil protein SlyX